MDQHLNLFRFFNEISETVFIENNLSRAFSICLINNSLFLSDYIKSIVTQEDYDYLFSTIDEDTKYSLNIQIDTNTIDREGYSTVYAVAMSSDNLLDMSNFFTQPNHGDKRNITDIIISIKDIAIIIEVKRTGEDCKAQLFNQVSPFIREGHKVIPKKFSWQETVKLMEKVKHIQNLMSQNSIFISDFLQLSEIRFPHWFEPKPFNLIPFSNQKGTKSYVQLSKRMRQALASSKFELLGYSDRLGISVPFGWASEIIPEFQSYKGNRDDFVVFYIWPGNTKQQGYQIFSKSMDWQNEKSLEVNGVDYELDIVFNVKFCHFNRYVSHLNFYESDILKPLHIPENFHKQSGKWVWNAESEKWCKGECTDFEKFMDEYFRPEFNWRKQCEWTDNFINTERNYFTMSLGYEVSVFIPFSLFKTLDNGENSVLKISNLINNIADSYQGLIDF